MSFYLSVSKSTIERYVRSFITTGKVKAKTLGRPLGTITFASREELIVMEAVLENPDKTLAEIADDIYRQTNSTFALSTLHYYLRRSGIMHKKVRYLVLIKVIKLRDSPVNHTINERKYYI